MKKSIIALLVVAAVVLTFSFSAGACTITGNIKYVIAIPTGQSIYVAPSSTSPFVSVVYRYFIPNASVGLGMAATAANASNQTVQVLSGVACPTTGATREAGTLTQLNILENF